MTQDYFANYGLDPLKLGEQKIKCPNCIERGVSNPNERCLSINLGKSVFSCHKCDNFKGILEKEEQKTEKVHIPAPDNYEITDKAKAFFESRGISLNTVKRFKVTADQSINFNFFKDGEVVNIKKRFPQKKFTLEKGGEVTFYNYDAIKDAEVLVITEGEIDAMTVYECDPNLPVVSLPNGANSLNFLDDEIDKLKEIKEVIIATDGDKAGILCRDNLLIRIGGNASYITYPDGTKDLNEALVQLGKESVLEMLKTPLKVPIKSVYSAEDYEQKIKEYIINGFPQGLVVNAPELDGKIRFGRGEFILITGSPNSGKSTLLDYLTTRHVQYNQGVYVGICSAEASVPIQITRIARHYLKKEITNSGNFSDEVIDTMTFINERYKFIDTSDMVDMRSASILEKMRDMNTRFGTNYFIIDPYNYIEREDTDHSGHAPVLRGFANFAKKYNSTVILVAHPRKLNKRDDDNYEVAKPYDISGSSDFYNIADTILSFWRDFVGSDGHSNKLYVQKVRNEWNGSAPAVIELEYKKEYKSFDFRIF